MKLRFHVVALPHLPCSKKYSYCAYTTKVWRFCKFMKELGNEVYLYAPETPEEERPPVTEFIQTIAKEEIDILYGVHPLEGPPQLKYEPTHPLFQLTNSKALLEIIKRRQPKDFVCLVGGTAQHPISASMPKDMMVVEPFIGYFGTFAQFRVYESYSHMSCVAGQQKLQDTPNPQFAVIPNYYEVGEFPFQPDKQDYYLYVGRITKLKGVDIAVEAARTNNVPIIIAGQGVIRYKPGHITYIDGKTEHDLKYENMIYRGVLGPSERAKLMGAAQAVFVPTQYTGPFEGVHAEAMLCGTPVITSDVGVFGETVTNGFNGFRCRVLKDYVEAVDKVKTLNYQRIRDLATYNWSVDNIKHRFQAYFEEIYGYWDWLKPVDKIETGNIPGVMEINK